MRHIRVTYTWLPIPAVRHGLEARLKRLGLVAGSPAALIMDQRLNRSDLCPDLCHLGLPTPSSAPPHPTPLPPTHHIHIIFYHIILYSTPGIHETSIRVASRIFQLGWGSSISATVQPSTLHEVGGRGAGLCQYWLIGPVGSARLVLQLMVVR